MKMINLNKTKVLLALAALMMTAACDSNKKDDGDTTVVTESLCYDDPTACTVGQQYTLGYYLVSTSNQSDINDRRAIDLKLAFYGSDGDAVYRSASNQSIFYTGPVLAIGSAHITIQDRDELSAPEDGNFNGNNNGNNNSRRCRIPEGDYTITTFQEGQWSQRPARKDANNDAKVESLELELVNNGNLISAVLENGAVKFRKDGLELTGTLSIQKLNKQNCRFDVQL